MYYQLTIPDENGRNHYFSFNFSGYSTLHRYEVKDVCIIDVNKIHDHRYDFKAFFYKKKYITYQENIRSKRELYSAIQNLLQKNLYQAVQ